MSNTSRSQAVQATDSEASGQHELAEGLIVAGSRGVYDVRTPETTLRCT
ncbi:MAG: hypothetical protein IVW57_05590, partial [Ktedonobacterales bacterium]|nr:hypothetical protein [Ktedonobacterales bacterium]